MAAAVSPLGCHGRCQRLAQHNRALLIERPPSLVAGGWLFVHVRVSGAEHWDKGRRLRHEPLDVVVDPHGVRLDDGPGAGCRGDLVQRVRAAYSSQLLLDAVGR